MMKKIIFSCLIVILLASCSSDKPPTVVEAEEAITAQIKNDLSGGEKLADLDIIQIGESGRADFEGPNSGNVFWNVTARVTITKTVRKDKFILKDKYYNIEQKPVEKQFHVWKNKSSIWTATTAAK